MTAAAAPLLHRSGFGKNRVDQVEVEKLRQFTPMAGRVDASSNRDRPGYGGLLSQRNS